MDIYVFQANFIRHFNTHITSKQLFFEKLKEKTKENYVKIKKYKIEISKNKLL